MTGTGPQPSVDSQRQAILLIEDDPADAEIIMDMLLSIGYETVWKNSLAAGVKTLATRPFAAIFLDLTLPDSDGVLSVASVHATGASAPIIVLTGHDDATLSMVALAAGAHEYLVKGQASEEDLAGAIGRAHRRHQALPVAAAQPRRVVALQTPENSSASISNWLLEIDGPVMYVGHREAPAKLPFFADKRVHFIDVQATGLASGRVFIPDNASDFDELAVDIELGCLALGAEAMVVFDSGPSLSASFGEGQAKRLCHGVASRMRHLGFRMAVVVHEPTQWEFFDDTVLRP